MAGDDGFLARWSRRKAVAKSGAPAVAPAEPPAQSAAPAAASQALPAVGEASAPKQALPDAGPPAPLPTLEDVARLTPASDFSPYVARDVDAGVRNAAMKKLFSDPHFNVMDGLDTYIDDYGKADPIPPSMLRRMNQSAVLGLFAVKDDPAVAEGAPPAPVAKACPDGGGPPAMAESRVPLSSPPAPEPRAHDDPDLRLQPDDADRRAGTGPRPGD